MGCSVCCGPAGGLPPNPAGCPCCGPDYDEYEDRYEEEQEPEYEDCPRCGDPMYADECFCYLCRMELEQPAAPESP